MSQDHIAEELAKIAAKFSQPEADPIAQELAKISAQFNQKSQSNEHEILNAKGMSLSESGQYQKAVTCFDQAINIKPNYFEAWHNRGNALCNLERYEQFNIEAKTSNPFSFLGSIVKQILSKSNNDSSVKQPVMSDKTISQLLEEGYVGIPYEKANDSAFVAAAHKFEDKINWTKTQPDEDGDIALMTTDVDEFQKLLDFMLDKFGWYPAFYSNDESPEIFIFTPKNELEEGAIALTTEGEYGWKGSLYSLDYVDKDENNNLCLIFAIEPKNTPEKQWLLVQLNLDKNQRGWSVHPGTLEQVRYIWEESIELSSPNYQPSSDEILDALESPCFPNIVKDFLSREYPDCIKDIYGENYGFISEQKLLNEWQELKETGKESHIQAIANKWKTFCPQQNSSSKFELFDYFDLPKLAELRLIYPSNLGFGIHLQGEPMNQNNSDDWWIVSNKTFEIIRILMVEMLWQSMRQNNDNNQFYTVEWLQGNFESFQAAKDHFGIKAKSWQKLADKLNTGH